MPLDSRRAFLSKTVSAVGTLAIANTTLYFVGSAFKGLDGSLVAGAKACLGPMPLLPSPCGPISCVGDPSAIGRLACGTYICDPGTGNYIPDSMLCLCPLEVCP